MTHIIFKHLYTVRSMVYKCLLYYAAFSDWHDDYAKGMVDTDEYFDAIEYSPSFPLFVQT